MDEKIKVIFLDFDGIINDYLTIKSFNKNNVRNLKTIIDKSGAKVVVSSSNKYSFQNMGLKDYKNTVFEEKFAYYLNRMGIEFYDFTPLVNYKREDEIEAYLKEHQNIEQFLILDDDYVIEKYKDHEIYLDLQSGLREKHIEPALRILNGELGFYYDHYNPNESEEDRVVRMNKIRNKLLAEYDEYER